MEFTERLVLWDKLAAQWQLSPAERAYIDRQQGTSCIACGANLRSIALANAIRDAVDTQLLFKEFTLTSQAEALAILEINEAGSLTSIISRLPGHILARYPDVDMHRMPYHNDQFDLVVHSDTLEHVQHPIRALTECRRVIRPGGWLCYTVPVIVDRLTRSRAGLDSCFHGNADTNADDFIVHTEFGSDMWTAVLSAGFTSVHINTVEFPAALSISAKKPIASLGCA